MDDVFPPLVSLAQNASPILGPQSDRKKVWLIHARTDRKAGRIDVQCGNKYYKKSPQVMGLRPPMCRTNFPVRKRNANPLNILSHLQLLCAQRGKELGLIWRVQSSSKQTEAHSWRHNAHQYKCLVICYRLAVI